MAQRYEAIAVRKYEANGEEKSAYTNIGVAFQMKAQDGYSLRLHCLPAPVDGEYTILLMPPKPKEDREPVPSQNGYAKQSGRDERNPPPRTSYDDVEDLEGF